MYSRILSKKFFIFISFTANSDIGLRDRQKSNQKFNFFGWTYSQLLVLWTPSDRELGSLIARVLNIGNSFRSRNFTGNCLPIVKAMS